MPDACYTNYEGVTATNVDLNLNDTSKQIDRYESFK